MSEFDKTEDKKVEKVLVHKAKQLQDRPNRNLYANVGIVAILGGIIVFPFKSCQLKSSLEFLAIKNDPSFLVI